MDTLRLVVASAAPSKDATDLPDASLAEADQLALLTVALKRMLDEALAARTTMAQEVEEVKAKLFAAKPQKVSSGSPGGPEKLGANVSVQRMYYIHCFVVVPALIGDS